MPSEYERQRDLNIKKNAELLKSLGLEGPLFEQKEQLKKPNVARSKKRKITATEEEGNSVSQPAPKLPRIDPVTTSEAEGLRRSSRNAGKSVNHNGETQRASAVPIAYSSGVKTSENTGRLGRADGVREYDPKTYGSIPGVQVGTWWETRQGCSVDAIHAPWVGGISGGKHGAYSVALSGGYDDDVDLGYAFTYTGSGGRDLKGTKNAPKNLRTAPQSSDQSFENNFNKMLKRSSETKKPVRVIRGFKVRSRYAPSEGYRYDGLYQVEKAWMEKGLNPKGFLVCKFVFKRLPGQPPLPVQDTEESVSSEQEQENDADVVSGSGSEEDTA